MKDSISTRLQLPVARTLRATHITNMPFKVTVRFDGLDGFIGNL